LNLAYRYWIP